MPYLENVVITNVYFKKKGTGKYGNWKLYNIKIDEPDWKTIVFSYFQTGNKVTPTENMRVKKLLFEEEENEGFTNYSVKAIELETQNEKPKPKPQPKPQPNSTQSASRNGYDPIWMAISYAKDLQCERIKRMNTADLDSITLNDFVKETSVAGKLLFKLIEEKEEPKDVKFPDEEPPFPIDDEDIPI